MSGIALVLGIVLGLSFGNPKLPLTRKWITKLLAYSIVALGAGMDLNEVLKVGVSGVFYTVIGISATILFGKWLSERLSADRESSLLISVGTAICGGSAIAAVAPTIRARPESVSLALATVFLLNAAALLLFPMVGHALLLSPHQFGLWCALAIHDTSSVVGASMQFGAEALGVATTVKLARAFWIAPVAFLMGIFFAPKKDGDLEAPPAKRPWFILGFLVAAAVFTYVPGLRPWGDMIAGIARWGLVLTLFLIGTTLSRSTLKSVGMKPLVFGVTLWAVVSILSLLMIREGWIR